jgi:SAM-dependent methyltransferase
MNGGRANAVAHDRVREAYDGLHPEIFNRTEQRRLERALDEAAASVRAPGRLALDFGSGTGNLTGKLLRRGFRVYAADVSKGMLGLLAKRFAQEGARQQLVVVQLEDDGLLPFPNGCFALVCAYSVLHHVPDYLAAVRELVRVTGPGGVLLIDHELNERYWRSPPSMRIHRALTMPGYSLRRAWARVRRLWGVVDPVLPPPAERTPLQEGDIHVYSDDHVEWPRVRAVCREAGFEELLARDYLLCRDSGRLPIRHWFCKFFAADMSLLIARRPLSATREYSAP